MSTKTKIFFTGATGYIGGSILTRLLKHPKFSSFEITALIRSQEKAAQINTFVVKSVVGSHSDLDLLEQQASESDVVIAAADADHLEAAKAILRGLKKQHEKTGNVPILIHTSGTGVLADDARGAYPGTKIYDDSNPEQIASLADTQPHRIVDIHIVAADDAGYVKTYIVLPSTIYGIASGPLVEAGFQNPYSVQVPGLIKASLDRGQGGVVGEGKNLWPNVHIDDVSKLYAILFDATLSGSPGHGRDGYYFGENGEHQLYDVNKEIAKVLYALGKGKSPEPTTFTDEETQKYFGGFYLGTNSRARASHSRSLGWSPIYTTKDLLASIKPEVEALLKGA